MGHYKFILIALLFMPLATLGQGDSDELDFLFSDEPAQENTSGSGEEAADAGSTENRPVVENEPDQAPQENADDVSPQQASENLTPVRRRRSSSRLVEEIVVTAQKREENLQDVPIAVAAFSGEKLEASGIDTTRDLDTVIPGLNITSSAGFDLIYLRGLGTSAFIPSFDPSVATYVDGIYIPSNQATLTDLAGVERVEVLKGPQGTLFGRNSTGGAINVITKNPSDQPELRVSSEVGTGGFDSYRTKVYGSYPVTEEIAVSFSGLYSSAESYYTATPDPQRPLFSSPPDYELNPERTRGGRVKLSWKPTDNLDFLFAYYDIKQTGSLAFTEVNVEPSPILGAPINAPPDFESHGNREPVSNSKTKATYGSATWRLPWFDTKLLVARLDQKATDLVYDFDGGQPDLVTFTAPALPSDLRTAELQFLSNDSGWTPDWLEWIAGFYFLEQEAGYDPFVAQVGGGDLLPAPVGGIVNDLLGTEDGLVGLGANGVLETNSKSVFLQGTVDFTDWFALTLGGRYQEEDRFLIKQRVRIFPPGGAEPLPLFNFNEPRRDQENFASRVVLEFTNFENTLLYTSWSRGFKSGSYNIVTLYAPPDYVDPEEVTTYEAGIKSTWIDGLTLNAAIFNNDVTNLQESTLALTTGGAIRAENAGSARTRGGEFDILWVPFLNWNPGFVVVAGASYVDAIYTDYQDASGFDEDTGLAFGPSSLVDPQGRDFSGNRIARTPEFTSTFALSQTIDTRYGPLEIAADWYYNGGFNFSAQNAESTEQDAYSLFNARTSFLYEPWNVRVGAFVRNIADEVYGATSLQIDFGTFQRLAPPRTYGLTVSYDLF